jgi:D-alanyl-D-alanine carboxypeptidase
VKRLVPALAVVAVLLAIGAPAAGAADRDDLRGALRTVLDAGAPGAIALVRHGAAVERAAVGTADLATGRAMSTADHVRVGSITKTFVAVVVLQLVAEHRLRLDDPVQAWLPGVLPHGAGVTVRQLLNHTSGVPDYLPRVAQVYATQPGSWLWHWSPRQLTALVADQPPLFPAGQQWSYSNTDYVLAGMLVERVTGRSLAGELDRRVLAPLGLRDTSLPTDTLRPPSPAARGYLPDPAGVPQDVTLWNPSAAWAAGGLVSTVDDIARFYRALLTGALLPPAQLAQLLDYVDAGGFGYGLGIFVLDTPCGPAIGHNGAVYGYAADAFTSPDGTRQVILASNLYPAASLTVQESLIATLFCG